MFVFADSAFFIWYFIMMGALVFGLVNTLVTSVMERVRELGMLRALGMRSRGVVAQVVLESSVLMLIGVATGIAVGWLAVFSMGDGIDLSQWGRGNRSFRYAWQAGARTACGRYCSDRADECGAGCGREFLSGAANCQDQTTGGAQAMNNDAVAVCSGITRTYQEESVPVHALRGVDFTFSRGDFVSLAGPSGSGKSTLLNILGGLDRPDSGTVAVDGVALNELNETQLSDLRLAQDGLRLPVLQPDTGAFRPGERRVHHATSGCRPRGARGTGRGYACGAGHGRPRAPPTGRVVRRPATAGGHRPRHRHRPGAAARRRTERQPRFRDYPRTFCGC